MSVIVPVEKGPRTKTSCKLIEVDLKSELKVIEVDSVAALMLRNSPPTYYASCVQLPVSLGNMWELTQVECSLTPPIPPIHSHFDSPHSHHSGMSPPGVWSLEGDPLQLPTSVEYNQPENWVGHGQYSTQPTTCINELNLNWWALRLHVCMYNSYSTQFTFVVCGNFV